MVTISFPMRNYNKKPILWWVGFVSSILLVVLTTFNTVLASGFGGWISEKLIDRDGLTDSNVLIGSGTTNSGLDVAMSGRATATGATNVYMDGVGTHATLNGNLATLNGFPSVYVYFQWGYDGVNYIGATTPQLMNATGVFTDTIAHFDPGKTVYYRAAVDSDGLSFSSPSTFITEGSIAAGFNLLNGVVVLVYIALMLFVTIKIMMHSTIAGLLFSAVAIYIGEAFIQAIQVALNSMF
jgi:hypothetical protein